MLNQSVSVWFTWETLDPSKRLCETCAPSVRFDNVGESFLFFQSPWWWLRRRLRSRLRQRLQRRLWWWFPGCLSRSRAPVQVQISSHEGASLFPQAAGKPFSNPSTSLSPPPVDSHSCGALGSFHLFRTVAKRWQRAKIAKSVKGKLQTVKMKSDKRRAKNKFEEQRTQNKRSFLNYVFLRMGRIIPEKIFCNLLASEQYFLIFLFNTFELTHSKMQT